MPKKTPPPKKNPKVPKWKPGKGAFLCPQPKVEITDRRDRIMVLPGAHGTTQILPASHWKYNDFITEYGVNQKTRQNFLMINLAIEEACGARWYTKEKQNTKVLLRCEKGRLGGWFPFHGKMVLATGKEPIWHGSWIPECVHDMNALQESKEIIFNRLGLFSRIRFMWYLFRAKKFKPATQENHIEALLRLIGKQDLLKP